MNKPVDAVLAFSAVLLVGVLVGSACRESVPPADPPATEAAAPMLIPACVITVRLAESDGVFSFLLTPGQSGTVDAGETSISVGIAAAGDYDTLRNRWPKAAQHSFSIGATEREQYAATVSGRAEDGPDRPSPPAPDPIPGDPQEPEP
jgi:hypothetical protein